MLDLTKPRNMHEMAEHDEFFGYLDLNGMISEFKLPLNVHLDELSIRRKCITEILLDGSKFSYYENGIYTNIPSVGIEIEDSFYYASISENAHMFGEYPQKYNNELKIVLDFISKYHEILLLHWKHKLNIHDICDFLSARVITVEKSQEDYDETYTRYNRINRKLRKLKKAKKIKNIL